MAKIAATAAVIGFAFSMLMTGVILANRNTLDLYDQFKLAEPDYPTLIRLLGDAENILVGLLSLPVSLFLLLGVLAGYYIKRPRFPYYVCAVICIGFIVGEIILIYHPDLYEKFLKSIVKSKVDVAKLCVAVPATVCCGVPNPDTCTEEIVGQVKLMGVFQVYVWGSFGANVALFFGAWFGKK